MLKPRLRCAWRCSFTPVFSLANQNRVDLFVYFTDGKGEERLRRGSKGYKVLWVLTGENPQLSLCITRTAWLVNSVMWGLMETQDIDEFVRMANRGGIFYG